MKAVIVAGGEGTRLRPLTYFKPKPLLPIWGIPIIEKQIAKLNKAGVTDIIINVGYKWEVFEKHFAGRKGITLSREEKPLGTAGAVKLAEPLFRDTENIIVLNADILTKFDYFDLISYHRLAKNDVSLFAIKVEDPSRFGLILNKSQSRDVEAFLEKMPLEAAKKYTDTFYVNGGIYVLKSSILSMFPENEPLSFEKDIFPTLLVKNYAVRRLDYNGYWLDIGTKNTYFQAYADAIWEGI